MTAPLTYFAYGSNMSTTRLRTRTPSARALGTATLVGHVLRFHKRSKDDSGKCNAFATGDSNDELIGVLFAIDPAERSSLDEAEGLNKGYRDATVTVVSAEGHQCKALAYFAMSEFLDDGLKPYSWYKHFVVVGAQEHALPADYIAKYIEQVAAVADPDTGRDKRERAVLG